MTKSLNDILKRYSDALSGKRESKVSALTTGDNPGVDYADKMKDARDFIAQHSVEKFDDRVGNGDDVYNASKVQKAKMERHGHEPKPKDIKVYNKNQQVGQPKNVKEEAEISEKKDESEYGYEGDMAITQLKTICRNSENIMKMLKPKTDLPEWVQSKITKAEDYISTAHDYLMSEMTEEVEELDELKGYGNKRLLRNVEKRATNRLIKATDPMWTSKSGMSDTNRKTASRNKNVADMARDRLGEEAEELDEAKCNMSEADTMCETHGMKACPKKDSASEPRYNGKDISGKRKLLTDKKIQEMAASQNQAISARIALKNKKEGTTPPKGTASSSMMKMTLKQLRDYTHAEKGAPKKVEEGLANHIPSKPSASEDARKEMVKHINNKKIEKMKMEQSAPAETPITMPSGAVGDTGRV
ncbi:MAG: hypothetical protein [Caudoviricetes sp.]|nr:MAG: hypothetical protein [Caudoviricetes sp.]